MSAREIIREGLSEALETMESMLVNEGQLSVFNNTIKPEFQQNAQASPFDGWDYVSCDPYCDFMGQTVETGNSIMENAFEEAFLAALEELILPE
jgi:hypothetical protein